MELLPGMPIDILLEIFMFLDPETLSSIHRTNKRFCHLLQSSDFAPVWREACAQYDPEIPPAPKGWTLVRWAGLLFGERCCQVSWGVRCKRAPELTTTQICLDSVDEDVISLAFLKRLCAKCIRFR